MGFLDTLRLPDQLKTLSAHEQDQLAAEVRQKILTVVSRNGGHLSSNLGTVELAVAVHAVFQAPQDKIIWDVGHQAYPHKLLTGRADRFHTLKKLGGISGLPNIDEGPYDLFTTGHAGPSISMAIGLTRARDLAKESHRVVAIIGDGAMTSGVSLEALNNVQSVRTNLIVILNDNEHSISPNVGALSTYFMKVRTSPIYHFMKDRAGRMADLIPKIGRPLLEQVDRLKDRLRRFVFDYKPEVIFEELGFKYLGPIDGHNIPLIMGTLQFAKEVNGPVLIHVVTQKGKGYPPAERDPVGLHGPAPFKVETGEIIKKPALAPSFTSVFGKTLETLAAANPRVYAVTAAMSDGTGLVGFSKRFPDRFSDVGIAEQHAISFAAGLAKGGYIPVAAIYSTFLQRAFDQIIHDVALQHLPVRFILDRAGVVGEDGPTHHGVFDIVYLRHIPTMVIMAPKDENELQHMVATCVSYFDGPSAVRFPRGTGLGVPMDPEPRPLAIGKGEVVFRTLSLNPHGPSSKIVLIGLGPFVAECETAAKRLTSDGYAVTVINPRFVKPLDRDLIVSEACDSQLVVTVEDGVRMGGFGSAVAELLNDENISVPLVRLGWPDHFIEHGPRPLLIEKYGLDAGSICDLVRHHHSLSSDLQIPAPSVLK